MVDGRREKLFWVGTRRKKMIKPGKGEKCKTQGPRGRKAGRPGRQADRQAGRLAGGRQRCVPLGRWVGLVADLLTDPVCVPRV